MRLLLVRHAETAAHADCLAFDGTMHELLTEEGELQADYVAKRLIDERIRYIYCSDIRSIATVHVISDAMPDVTVMLTKDLRTKDADESDEDFKKRIATFIDGLLRKYSKEVVLLVTHDDVIYRVIDYIGQQISEPVSHASITEYDLDASGKTKLIRYNDTSHL